MVGASSASKARQTVVVKVVVTVVVKVVLRVQDVAERQ